MKHIFDLEDNCQFDRSVTLLFCYFLLVATVYKTRPKIKWLMKALGLFLYFSRCRFAFLESERLRKVGDCYCMSLLSVT